jgi:hypothetical protein
VTDDELDAALLAYHEGSASDEQRALLREEGWLVPIADEETTGSRFAGDPGETLSLDAMDRLRRLQGSPPP